MANENVGDESVVDEATAGQSVAGGQRSAGGHHEVPDDPVEMTEETSTGLDETIAGALAYVLGFITGIIFFVIEPDNEYVKFHAAQSIVVFGAIAVFWMVFSFVSSIFLGLFTTGFLGFVVGGLLALVFGLGSLVLGLGSLVLWLYLIVKTAQGETVRVPVAAGYADKIVK